MVAQNESMYPLLAELGIEPADYERQCALELEGFSLGIDLYNMRTSKVHNDVNLDNTQLAPENALMRTFIESLSTGIASTVRSSIKGGGGLAGKARKFLAQIDPDRLAFLTLRYSLNLKGESELLLASCVRLGRQIERDYEYMQFQSSAPGYLSKVEENLKSAHLRHRHKVLQHAANKVELRDETGKVIGKGIPPLNWNDEMRFNVGKILLECITSSTPLFRLADAHVKVITNSADYGFIAGKKFYLERTDRCCEILEKAHLQLSEMRPLVYPGVIPPKPWHSVYGGGFWTQYKALRSKMIRTRNRKALKRADAAGVTRVAEALNAIGQTKFRINTQVLEVMKESAKVGFGGLPAPDKLRVEIDGHYPLEEPCPWTDAEIKQLKATRSEQWVRWTSNKAAAWDIWHRANSKRISLLWKLKIAEQFKAEKAIYFYWNLDYRGRVYCFQPYINPQVDDSGKSLLEFADGVALGDSGAKWLMIHGANEFGFDKATLEERVAWVKEHHHQILDSAENPLDGQRFWCQADHPFCFLAFCLEYAGYVAQGNDFVSHLPIQVDGTCSGLQHYSALLADSTGAAAVNLIPSDKKADVYGEVAKVANTLLERDLKKGGDEAQFARAWLQVGVDRSICKRNVMTFCYGATRPGFAQQLIDHVVKKCIRLDGVDQFKACNYMAGINWEAVSMVLVKSVQAMQFLQKLAFFTAKQHLDIQWTSPIGLRVTQDYLKTKSKCLDTFWGSARIQPKISVETADKDTAGSRNGIAPNYIHSLDASHLMLTVLACKANGIDAFSLIHDSFGTHAARMETMNQLIRETFIEMYSGDLLETFVADLREQIPADKSEDFEKLVSELKPTKGDLDVCCVRTSPYFFS